MLFITLRKNMKSLFILSIFIFFTSCGYFETSEIKKEAGKPGLFSKDSEKGINISKLLSRDEDSNNFYVNAFLWRASIDVVSIAPLISTDAFGGTILTDWYIDPKIKDKKIKLAVFVKSQELRSDGISVKVYFKSIKSNNTLPIKEDKKLASKIEELILSKARDLRIKNLK